MMDEIWLGNHETRAPIPRIALACGDFHSAAAPESKSGKNIRKQGEDGNALEYLRSHLTLFPSLDRLALE
jgi:hypothetical protein